MSLTPRRKFSQGVLCYWLQLVGSTSSRVKALAWMLGKSRVSSLAAKDSASHAPLVALGQRVAQPPVPGKLLPSHQLIHRDVQGDAAQNVGIYRKSFAPRYHL